MTHQNASTDARRLAFLRVADHSPVGGMCSSHNPQGRRDDAEHCQVDNQPPQNLKLDDLAREIIFKDAARKERLAEKQAEDRVGAKVTEQIYRSAGAERAALQREHEWRRTKEEIPLYAAMAIASAIALYVGYRTCIWIARQSQALKHLRDWWRRPSTSRDAGPLMPTAAAVLLGILGLTAGLERGYSLTYAIGMTVEVIAGFAALLWVARWIDGKKPSGADEKPPAPRP